MPQRRTDTAMRLPDPITWACMHALGLAEDLVCKQLQSRPCNGECKSAAQEGGILTADGHG